jgi:hypothetical protein
VLAGGDCAADAATGFYYNTSSNAWEVASFKTEGKRYVLKERNGEWSWTELGDSYATPCDAPASNGVISCRMGKSVYVSTSALRYQADMTAAFTIQERGSSTATIRHTSKLDDVPPYDDALGDHAGNEAGNEVDFRDCQQRHQSSVRTTGDVRHGDVRGLLLGNI